MNYAFAVVFALVALSIAVVKYRNRCRACGSIRVRRTVKHEPDHEYSPAHDHIVRECLACHRREERDDWPGVFRKQKGTWQVAA